MSFFFFFCSKTRVCNQTHRFACMAWWFSAVLHRLMSWMGFMRECAKCTSINKKSEQPIFCSRVCGWQVAALLTYLWQAPAECSNNTKKKKSKVWTHAVQTKYYTLSSLFLSAVQPQPLADKLTLKFQTTQSCQHSVGCEWLRCSQQDSRMSVKALFSHSCCPSHSHTHTLYLALMLELKAYWLF